MSDLRKAAEMALEALDGYPLPFQFSAKQALRQALAQPEQESVECMCGICKLGKREWVGLTEEEFKYFKFYAPPEIVWQIEDKLKEKNT